MKRLIIAVGLVMALIPLQAQENARELVRRAFSFQEAGDLDRAIFTFSQAIENEPGDHRLYVFRGVAHQQKQDFEAAEKDFTQAISMNPNAPLALFRRGTIRLDRGQTDEAIADFDATLKLIPRHDGAHFLKAMAFFNRKDLQKAAQGADQAVAANPRNAEARCLRGLLALKNNRPEDAARDFQRATQIRTDYAMAWYGRGRAAEALGRQQEASEYITMACGLNKVFCSRETFMARGETELILNSSAVGERYCLCCLIFDSEGVHQEGKVQNLLAQRARHQLSMSSRYKVYKDFSFRDRYIESGIRFEHKSTDDSGRFWKPVHYDHGNGLAVADVDGDGLLDIYFTTQLGANELWRNLGNGRFEDITARSGVAVEDRISVAPSFADIDNDGDPDLFVTTVRMGNLLFENKGGGVFEDITKTAGVGHVGHSSGAIFFDYDNDGLLDLFVTNVGSYTVEDVGPGGYFLGRKDAFSGHLHANRTEYSILYHNDGNRRFSQVDQILKDGSWSGDATIVDLNNDTFPDLYLVNMQGDDRYYENQAGKGFVDKTAKYFPKTSWGAMSVGFFDYNNDGHMDLYTTDMHSDMSKKVGPAEEKKKADMQWDDEFLQGGTNNLFGNSFYHNNGDGTFKEVSDSVGVENYWPWGLSVADLNADGYQDIFVASSMNFPWRYGINSVFLNDRGQAFMDSEFILGIEPRATTIKPWFVSNCSGAENDQAPPCAGKKGVVIAWGAYGSRSAAIFDLDGDGDLDIVTSEFHSEPQVLISNLTDKKKVNHLKVKLVGTQSNRNGLGAHVKLVAGGQTYARYYDGKSGYLSQSQMPLYFGLDQIGKIDSIEIIWPSGKKQTITKDLKINSQIVVKEPTS